MGGGTRRASGNQRSLVGSFDLQLYRHPKGYIRVSTDEQAEEGTSIETQIRQLCAYAAAFGLNLSEADLYIDEGWSGKDLDRPAMRQLRADAQAGRVDCVLVTKLDRLSRNLRDTVNLCLGEWQDEAPADRKIVLKSISEPFDTLTDFGRMVFGLLAMFAEFERRRIADRTWAGKTSRAEAGRNAGQRPAYGFRLVATPEGRGSTFAVVAEEAQVIQRICELYLGGHGDQQIARRLNEEGLRARGGVLWQTQHVTRILTNPLIAGRYAYGRHARGPDGSLRRLPEAEWVMSQQPAVPAPVIAPRVFEQIRHLRQQRQTAVRRVSRFCLLSGLVRCDRCGSACGVKTAGPGGAYRYYQCLRRKQSGTLACTQPNIRADELDRLILTAVEAVLHESRDALNRRLRAQDDRRRQGLAQRLTELHGEQQRLQGLRRDYFAWLERGQLRPESVQDRLAELDQTQRQAGEQCRRLEAELVALEESCETTELEAGWWSELCRALSTQERKQLLTALVARVELNGTEVLICWTHDLHQVQFAWQA